MGIRLTIAREARQAVHARIVRWVQQQAGTQQALCRKLNISASQLSVLVKEGVERCSLEYLLDVWQRCGGSYSLELRPDGREAVVAKSHVDRAMP